MNKYILIIIVLLVAIGIGAIALNKLFIGQDYFNWARSVVLSRINLLIAGLSPNLFFRDSGQDDFQEMELDFSQINVENLLSPDETSGDRQTEAVAQTKTDEQVTDQEQEQAEQVIAAPQLITLEQIEQNINAIKTEAERIEKEINKLRTLVEIQEKINKISQEVNVLSQEIEELVLNAQTIKVWAF